MKNVFILLIAIVIFLLTSCSSKSGKRATGPKTFLKGTVVGVGKVTKFDDGTQSYPVLIDKDSNGVGDVEFLIREKQAGMLLHKTQIVTLVIQQGQITGCYE